MKQKELTIPDGQNVSEWLTHKDIFGSDPEADRYIIGRIICPATLSSIASLTFESHYGGVEKTVKNEDGATVTVYVSANADIALRPANHTMVPPKFRIKSNVNASGDKRTFIIQFRKA